MKKPEKANVLLIGCGGREHAIAWKLSQSPDLAELVIMPGNPGTANHGLNISGEMLSPASVLKAAKQRQSDLVMIGPEAPLGTGVSDALRAEGIPVFGPSSAAAQLETSKSFAKAFMERNTIPSAKFKTFKGIAPARAHLETIPYAYVIKVSGLAAGKGVFLPETKNEALAILADIFESKSFGAAGNEIVIEERLEGTEVSLLAFTDGKEIVLMPPAQDHKRLLDDDQGPNTGGMGVFAPSPYCTQEHVEQANQTIIQPTVACMAKEGNPYSGVLYAGLMLTPDGPQALEYNCRFGDPETQVLLPLLEGDLLEIAFACSTGQLSQILDNVRWKDGAANCVVLASRGYPGGYPKGLPITGMENVREADLVFHAGTKIENGKLVTDGGRVLGVTATGKSLQEAVELSYQALTNLHFEGMHYRKDIGKPQSAYQAAGVSIASGNRALALIKQAIAATHSPEVLSGLGSFGGLYDAQALKKMDNPVLVSSTDGVGTKVILAAKSGNLKGLGHDIVNHCLNDILVQGARPLFFMDYFASSSLVPEQLLEIVSGISEACCKSGCALLGGETAEMPGVYTEENFDLVGTIVGVVNRENILPKKTIKAGDAIIGLSSSGPHTNGYSLIRKIFENVPLDRVYPDMNKPIGEALLAPHKSYLGLVQPLLSSKKQRIKGMAHITGGGFYDNIPRILPDGCGARIDRQAWPVPTLFKLIQNLGQVTEAEMYQIFNMGIGMVVIVSQEDMDTFQKAIPEETWLIGEVTAGKEFSIA